MAKEKEITASHNKVDRMSNLNPLTRIQAGRHLHPRQPRSRHHLLHKSASGEKHEEVTYVDVTFWGKMV